MKYGFQYACVQCAVGVDQLKLVLWKELGLWKLTPFLLPFLFLVPPNVQAVNAPIAYGRQDPGGIYWFGSPEWECKKGYPDPNNVMCVPYPIGQSTSLTWAFRAGQTDLGQDVYARATGQTNGYKSTLLNGTLAQYHASYWYCAWGSYPTTTGQCDTCPPNAYQSGDYCVASPQPPNRKDLGPGDMCVGNPVNPGTGNKDQPETDYSFGTLYFGRHYNRSNAVQGVASTFAGAAPMIAPLLSARRLSS